MALPPETAELLERLGIGGAPVESLQSRLEAGLLRGHRGEQGEA